MNREELLKLNFAEITQAAYDKKITIDEFGEWITSDEVKCAFCEYYWPRSDGAPVCTTPDNEEHCRRALGRCWTGGCRS